MRRLTCKLVLLTVAAMAAQAQDAPLSVGKMVSIATPARIQTVSLCGTTGLVAGLAHGGAVYVWRIPSGQLVASRAAEDGIRSLACSPDGKWLALGRGDGTVAITDASGKTAGRLAVSDRGINDVAFSPDGSLLAANPSGAPVQLWNVEKRKRVAELQTDFSDSAAMTFSPDGARFATPDTDTRVRIYDRSGKLQATYAGFLLEPFAISFTHDSKQVVVGGADCMLTFLDASDGHVLRQLAKQPDPIFWAAALPNGVSVVSLHIDAAALGTFTMLLWDVPAGTPRKLGFDARHMVGFGTSNDDKPLFMTADSDTSLTAWVLSN